MLRFWESLSTGNSSESATATAASIGLGDVDNTRDVDKPVSTAQQAAIDKKLDITSFKVLNSLPGLPVTDVTLALLPALTLVKIDSSSKVESLTDPLTKTVLSQSDDSMKPTLKIDDKGRAYLEFNNSRLGVEGFSASSLGGSTGKTTSFMLVVKTKSDKRQCQFNWVKGSPGSYNLIKRLAFQGPYGDGKIYMDHASVTKGRMVLTSQQDTIGLVTSWFYERNGSESVMYKNGVEEGGKAGLTSALDDSAGRLMLGDGNELGLFADMDFYGLFFYNRVLSDEEKAKMFLFSKSVFGV